MKRLNGGEYLIDLSNGTIDDGALLGVNEEFLSLFPIVRGNIKKNRIYVKMNDIIIPCIYMISGLVLTISGLFNDGENGLVLISIACEYDVDEYDVVSIVGIEIDSVQKDDVLSTADIESGLIDNAKPLYFHPINVDDDASYCFAFTIINNSDTPIDTWAKIIAWAKSIQDSGVTSVRIPCSGSYYDTNNNKFYVIAFLFFSNDKMYFLGCDSSTGDVKRPAIEITNITPLYVNDGVNKIN